MFVPLYYIFNILLSLILPQYILFLLNCYLNIVKVTLSFRYAKSLPVKMMSLMLILDTPLQLRPPLEANIYIVKIGLTAVYIFIARCDIGVQLSVRPFIRSFVRPSTIYVKMLTL